MDWLEKKIQELKLEQAEPPKDHRNRFEGKLNKQHQSLPIFNWHIPAYAASILILLSIFTLLLLNNNRTDNTLILSSETEEYFESELYFRNQVSKRIATIENLDHERNADLKDIESFDKSLQSLKDDLKQAPGDQRILEAVLNTYMLKIEALDNIVNILQKTS